MPVGTARSSEDRPFACGRCRRSLSSSRSRRAIPTPAGSTSGSGSATSTTPRCGSLCEAECECAGGPWELCPSFSSCRSLARTASRPRRRRSTRARAAAAELPRLHSLMVAQNGRTLLEYYAQGRGRAARHQRQVGVEERHLDARRHRHRAAPHSGRASADRGLLSRAGARRRSAQAPDHHRRPADHAIGADLDQLRQLRRVGRQPRTGSITCCGGRWWPTPAKRWSTAPATRISCPPS